ncbi:flagellar motor switch protein FliN [Clostridium transplantifaecale]|uniref:flagellar motor switch protein FliN n=1 Tax=Clostridium transplantifaecale TaxID=2479838 RepID=UPI000F6327AE|nr:flagellar motor switch protein FliN [Clostridium transplantifaecale]
MTNEQVVIFHDIMGLFAKRSGESLSSILKSNIEIKSPQLKEMKVKEVEYALLEPVIFVKFCLTDGAAGTIAMIFRQRDMQVFLNELMGNDDLPEPDFLFDEVAVSAAGEIMSQMTKTAADAISEYLVEGAGMRASSCQLLLSDDGLKLEKVMGGDGEDTTNVITYKLVINDMIESEFIQCLSEEAFQSIEEAMEQKIASNKEKLELERALNLQNIEAGAGMAAGQAQASSIPVQQATGALATQAENLGGAVHPAVQSQEAEPAVKGNLGLIMNVPLNVCVEIGKTKRKLRDVLNFNNGTVIELDKAADAPVDIIVNGQLIARGEVVVIDDNFGVKVSEIINTRNIIRNGGLS